MTGSDDEPDPGTLVARRVNELRTQHQLSLEGLARLSGVSRAMLWQIEQERSAPTVKVLGRVAAALGVPLVTLLQNGPPRSAELLRAADTKRLRSPDGGYVSRALFPYSGARAVEFYEIQLEPGACETAAPHAPGTLENLVLHAGIAEIEVGAHTFTLAPGDALHFRADVAHCYRNPAAEPALIYLVMIHPSPLNYG